ncbi:MAG: hypothetical protein K0U54_12730 [Bacteroidetes bacterium]|nr:hypothetical protein [Bacteroidota bacterium]
MDIILVFTAFFFFALSLLFIASRLQYKKGQRLGEAFSTFNLQSMDIRFSETSSSGLSQFGGGATKAILYYGDGLLLIVSKDKWFNRLHNNLPLLFTSIEHKKLPIGFHFKAIENFSIDKYIHYTIEEASFIKRRLRISLSSETDPDALRQILDDFQITAKQQVKALL